MGQNGLNGKLIQFEMTLVTDKKFMFRTGLEPRVLFYQKVWIHLSMIQSYILKMCFINDGFPL